MKRDGAGRRAYNARMQRRLFLSVVAVGKDPIGVTRRTPDAMDV